VCAGLAREDVTFPVRDRPARSWANHARGASRTALHLHHPHTDTVTAAKTRRLQAADVRNRDAWRYSQRDWPLE